MDRKANRERTLEQMRLCCRALDEKKAEGLKVLRVEGISPVTDYLILATGTSEPHLKALRDEVEKTMRMHRIHLVGSDRETSSGWLVMDAFDFMIHLFTREKRSYYSLETLWKDADEVMVTEAISA